MSARHHGWLTAGAIFLLSSPPISSGLMSTMTTHMLVQLPALVACGVLLASDVPRSLASTIGRFNAHGLVGLVVALCVTAVWMVPRAIDEAVIHASVNVAKTVSLVGAGFLGQISWKPAGPVLQLFFLGNWVWMTAAVGLIYLDVPGRLCNAYLVNDQHVAGCGLVVLSLGAFALWLVWQYAEQPTP